LAIALDIALWTFDLLCWTLDFGHSTYCFGLWTYCVKLIDMSRRAVPSIILLAIVLCYTSCAASLFKVKPVSELPPLPAATRSTETDAITLRVAPLLSDEESQELFEANLQVSGVLPVRLELLSKSAPIELKKARFHLRDSGGKEWKLLTPKNAVSAIMKANGIFAYNPNFRKQFEEEFGSYGMDIKTPLIGNSTRSGFLFFRTPDKRPVQSNQQLTLTIEHLPSTATIQIN
jgi:hypothetical protein